MSKKSEDKKLFSSQKPEHDDGYCDICKDCQMHEAVASAPIDMIFDRVLKEYSCLCGCGDKLNWSEIVEGVLEAQERVEPWEVRFPASKDANTKAGNGLPVAGDKSQFLEDKAA